MDNFGAWLQQMLGEREISANEFARRVGKTSGYISLVLRGERLPDGNLKTRDVPIWADALGIPPDELDEVTARHGRPKRQLTERELSDRFGIRPYIQPLSIEGVTASAGKGKGVPQGIDDTISRSFAQSKTLREVDVEGDCMVPDLMPGEIVVYNTNFPPEIGKIMVALRDEEELLIKRLIYTRDDQWLHPNEGLDIRVDERIRFLGRAVAVTRRLV